MLSLFNFQFSINEFKLLATQISPTPIGKICLVSVFLIIHQLVEVLLQVFDLLASLI